MFWIDLWAKNTRSSAISHQHQLYFRAIMKKRTYRLTIWWYIALWIVLVLPQEVQVVSRIRIVVGSVMLLFVPGWRITCAIFDEWEIDELESVALSFAFSISVIPLLVFYLNLIWLKINQWLVYWVVGLCVVASRWRIQYKLKATRLKIKE